MIDEKKENIFLNTSHRISFHRNVLFLTFSYSVTLKFYFVCLHEKREGQKQRIDISVCNKKNKKSVCLIDSCQDFVSSKRIKMCRKLYKHGKVKY